MNGAIEGDGGVQGIDPSALPRKPDERPQMKALVVAEEDIARRVGRALRLRWPDLELTVANGAQRVPRLLADNPPDILFISAALPAAGPLTLIGQIRASADSAIMVVGSKHDEADIAEALEAGADDYLPSTISDSLFVARVSAALRRARKCGNAEEPALKCGDLAIDPERHEAHLNRRALYLTPTEFKLLYTLAQRHGLVVTQRALETAIWGCADDLYLDVLRKHVQRLRRKLESRRGSHTTITTLPRIGYKLIHRS